MNRRDKKENRDDGKDEWEDDWQRLGFFDEFFDFDSIDDHFDRMRRYMDRIFQSAMEDANRPPALGEERNGRRVFGPFVYGFSARVSPDGRPHVEEFGNVPPRGFRQLDEGLAHLESGPQVQPEASMQRTIPGREPLTDICEGKDEVYITLEIPGVEKKDIDLQIREDELSVGVEHPQRNYHKDIQFPYRIEPDSVKATYKNGVLDITLKKSSSKERQGRKVEIE